MNEKKHCYCNSCREKRTNPAYQNYSHYCNQKDKKLHDRNDNSTSNTNTFNPIFNPSITINLAPGHMPGPIGVETLQYITLAKDDKKTYTNDDALKEYGSSNILDPKDVSTINLFVNGVLQPESIYTITEGELHLESSDLPPKDAPIIILFITVKG